MSSYEGLRFKAESTNYYALDHLGDRSELQPVVAILDEDAGGYVAFTAREPAYAAMIAAALNAYHEVPA